MNKIYMSLGVMLMLSLTLVSAATYSNVEVTYNKKANVIHVELDQTLDNECIGVGVNIFNHKDSNVRKPWVWDGGALPVNCIVYQNGTVIWGGRTGTFHASFDVELVGKNEIKGLGNLEYELYKSREVLNNGRIR